MSELVYAGNKALYLMLCLSAWPVAVATIIGLLVGICQTVTQLQEQTLPFGLKLLGICICFFLLSGWYGDILLGFGKDMMRLALSRG
ncbi:EscS/YscS/HrcS family type III secretion system export apparatus protein [Salmonella enterica]|uniref:Surface presentation of antigens protein SpaQ n=1 Tax=Salmonella enterica TaxID=28901 RepID=A0A759KBG4_SALER|nr:EscS/YscS/HrcS family type III secretion system export apparatus protein [Salmonella enterica subsp. enterica serovar Freetown]EBN9932879.1 EscS/YscS/HrcS family type III secretion system export apparatus protein [Salmonella enterica]EBS3610400.1 EscS/YscS/HrcS family type III secretion system export apparatus protein [Salmonella enterica subsp. enterica serovar Poona]EBH8792731.1 EscS/YscS/HrcS family type III secretion system export apparatus protein [Salmonella enterica subsp. enterica ser